MRGTIMLAVGGMAMTAGAAFAEKYPPIPAVVMAHVQDLDRRCTAAGGKPGEGRFMVAQDFTGDGRRDYLLSEGNYQCLGRPDIFRSNGEARVNIFVVNAANQARRLYSDVLTGYRVLAGQPAKVQIARKGAACGPNATAKTQCATQLVWNGQGFGQGTFVSSDDNKTGRAQATAAPTAAPAPAPAPAPANAAAPATFALRPNAEAEFLKQCRADYVRAEASAARWADGQCKEDWKRVVASGPAAEAMLAVLPAQGERPALATVKQRATGVRWAARAEHGQSASGTLGGLSAYVEGAPTPTAFAVGWSKVGEMIPYDVPGALRARGVTVTEVACEKQGVGEGTRTYAGTAAGRAPFTLTVFQRTAPTGGAYSFYDASANLGGKHPARGSSSGCDF